MQEIGRRGGEVYRENKIVIFGRVMRGGLKEIDKDSIRPTGCIGQVTQFSEW